jgi:hypothetical protein
MKKRGKRKDNVWFDEKSVPDLPGFGNLEGLENNPLYNPPQNLEQ